MPESKQNDVQRTSEGMIRNFGNAAEYEAEKMVKRYAKDPDYGGKFWLAVVMELRGRGAQQ